MDTSWFNGWTFCSQPQFWPKLRLGTKCPSIKSRCIHFLPSFSTSRIELFKSAWFPASSEGAKNFSIKIRDSSYNPALKSESITWLAKSSAKECSDWSLTGNLSTSDLATEAEPFTVSRYFRELSLEEISTSACTLIPKTEAKRVSSERKLSGDVS